MGYLMTLSQATCANMCCTQVRARAHTHTHNACHLTELEEENTDVTHAHVAFVDQAHRLTHLLHELGTHTDTYTNTDMESG